MRDCSRVTIDRASRPEFDLLRSRAGTVIDAADRGRSAGRRGSATRSSIEPLASASTRRVEDNDSLVDERRPDHRRDARGRHAHRASARSGSTGRPDAVRRVGGRTPEDIGGRWTAPAAPPRASSRQPTQVRNDGRREHGAPLRPRRSSSRSRPRERAARSRFRLTFAPSGSRSSASSSAALWLADASTSEFIVDVGPVSSCGARAHRPGLGRLDHLRDGPGPRSAPSAACSANPIPNAIGVVLRLAGPRHAAARPDLLHLLRAAAGWASSCPRSRPGSSR